MRDPLSAVNDDWILPWTVEEQMCLIIVAIEFKCNPFKIMELHSTENGQANNLVKLLRLHTWIGYLGILIGKGLRKTTIWKATINQ